jgi:Zn-dependent protease
MGSPFGIPIYVTPTWFLIAAFVTVSFAPIVDSRIPGLGAWRYVIAFTFAVLLYLSVIVHELAHSLVAKHFGLPVRRIAIYFLGGVSEIEREPETPGREFAVAVAGPLLSLVIAGLAFVLLALHIVPADDGTTGTRIARYFVGSLYLSNLLVAGFNLLPGLPLDGGRILRAAVWAVTKRPMYATVAAARFGRVVAIAVIAYALYFSSRSNGVDAYLLFMGMFMASFIWIGAGQAVTVAKLRERLPDVQARSLTRPAIGVDANLPLAEALRRAAEAGARGLVIVGRQGEPTALVDESAVVATPEQRRPWIDVSAVARALQPGMVLSADLGGEQLIAAMRAMPTSEYLVLETDGQIFGVLAAADVQRAFA